MRSKSCENKMLGIIYELANSGIKTQLNNNFKFKEVPVPRIRISLNSGGL